MSQYFARVPCQPQYVAFSFSGDIAEPAKKNHASTFSWIKFNFDERYKWGVKTWFVGIHCHALGERKLNWGCQHFECFHLMTLAKRYAPLSDLSSSVKSECWAWRGSHALHCKACTGSVFDFLEGSRHFWRVCSGAGLDSNLGTDSRFGAKSFLIMKTWFECLSFFPPWKWMGKRNLWWRSTLRCTSWKYLDSFPIK